MGWKFWQKNRSDENQRLERGPKLPRVKELPNEVGRHLIVAKGYEPDWVWALRCAVRPIEDSKNRLEIRVFSPDAASKRGVAVKNYTSLDACPELILFAGWYDKATRRVQLENLLDKAV